MFSRRAYLLDVTDRTPLHRVLQELIDILVHCLYTEFILFSERGDFSLLDLKKLALYCDMQGIALKTMDRSAYEDEFVRAECVFAPTCAARSLAGRVEDMREEMERAEALGRARGVRGFMVTDFSDSFAWHPWITSLPGIILGGNFASAGNKSSHMDLEKELDRTLDAPIGGLLLKLGTLYLRGGAPHRDASEYFNILSHDVGYSRHPGLTDTILNEVSGIAHGIRIAAERWIDRTDWAKELAYMANLLDCACHRRDERRLREVRDEHGRVWRMRFMPDGRVESLAKLPRF